MKKILGLILSVCMLVASMSIPANAQDSQETTVEICNFEELKEVVYGEHSVYTKVKYLGEEPLVIEEDIVLPDNIEFYFSAIRIPSDVTFTTGSEYVKVDRAKVEGTLINSRYFQVTFELTITGKVFNLFSLQLFGGAVLTGKEKISHDASSDGITWLYVNGVDTQKFIEAVGAANIETDSNVKFHINVFLSDILLSGALVIPANTSVIILGENNFTITESCKLDLHGTLQLSGSTLNVLGTLNNTGTIANAGSIINAGTIINTGTIGVSYNSAGTFTIVDNGSYTGNGVINIYGAKESEFSSVVPGLDLTKYKATECVTSYNVTYWELRVDTGFEDVEAYSYYEMPVIWAVENGITNGHGSSTTFCPKLDCTRGQVVTFLWRAKGCPEPVSLENPFTDVAEDAYYYKAVLWAVEQGITNGYGSETTFCPDMECTRGQVATFMWRAEGKPAVNNAQNTFTDVKSGEYYYDAVLWAVENGVTNGYGSADTFCPDVICNRGQIVTFLYRGMN